MKKGDKNSIRIKDIAALACVSEGTVDRVLHNRGNVSTESRMKVEKVLQDLDYQPNIYASALAHKRKPHLIIALIPHTEISIYWQNILDGINEAEEELKSLNVVVKLVEFDQYNSQDFVTASKKALDLHPQGIIFPPIFAEESLNFLNEAKELNIGVSTLDSYIESDNIVSFIGQNGYQSGHLVAKILLMQHVPHHEILVFISQRTEKRVSTQFSQRYGGFYDFIQESPREKIVIHKVELPFYDEEQSAQIVEESLLKYPNANAMVIFNSRSYILGRVLNKLDRKDINIVGYDIVPKSVEYLKNGYISALIGTQPKLQGYRATKSLCESVILKQNIRKLNFIPLDILFAENIDFYTQFDFK